MNILHQPKQLTGATALLIGLLLLPIGCLLWQWNTLPAQVPVHFSRGGADRFEDKHILIGLVLLPFILYSAVTFLYQTKSSKNMHRQIGIGTAVFLSLVLCVWLLTGMPSR